MFYQLIGSVANSRLLRHDVAGLWTFGAIFNVESDRLVFLESTKTIALNSAEVNENVFATIIL